MIFIGWLVGGFFYGISTFVKFFYGKSIFMQKVLFQTIHLSMTTQLNCQKTFLFQAIQFSQTVLNLLNQFSVGTDFIYPQLNVKTVMY